jgi:hypothetical protein
MGLFRRRPKPDAGTGKAEEPDLRAARTVHERIEVTVEREWVSMVMRNPAAGSAVVGAVTEAREPAVIEATAERTLDAPDKELPKGG